MFSIPRWLALVVGIPTVSISGCASEGDPLSAGARNVTAADAGSTDDARNSGELPGEYNGERAGDSGLSGPNPGAVARDPNVLDAGTTAGSGFDAAAISDAGSPADATPPSDAGVAADSGTVQDAATLAADAGLQANDAMAPRVDASNTCSAADCSYSVGNASVDESWGELRTQPDQMYLVPIVAPRRAALQTFKFFSRDTAVPATGQCCFAIYDDQANRPHQLLTWSVLNAWAVDGESCVAPGSTGIRFVAGAKYWVGIECFHPSGSVRLRSKAVSDSSIVQLTHTFGTDYPEQFPNMSQSTTGTALGVFVEAKDLP